MLKGTIESAKSENLSSLEQGLNLTHEITACFCHNLSQQMGDCPLPFMAASAGADWYGLLFFHDTGLFTFHGIDPVVVKEQLSILPRWIELPE